MDEHDPGILPWPGDTVLDILEACSDPDAATTAFYIIAHADLGWQQMRISSLLDGVESVTPHMAEFLSRTVGLTPEFWLERERRYRDSLDRREQWTEVKA